jgi:hypothetical protein
MTDPFEAFTAAYATASERANDAHAEWQQAQDVAKAATEKADALFQAYMKLTYARDQAADALYEARLAAIRAGQKDRAYPEGEA